MKNSLPNEKRLYLSVDRIEGNFAVCIDDDKNTVELILSKINGQVKEGDMIFLSKESGIYTIDKDETEKRRLKNAQLLKALFQP